MSLQRKSLPAIPPETVQVAKAAFPSGNIYMQMRDELGTIYEDELFASVYAEVGQPAIAPWRLALCQQRGYLRTRGRQRTDSTHVLGAVKALNSLELVGETLRHALNVLATVVPEWLKQQVKPEWFDRYGQRMEDYRLRHPTKANVLPSVPPLARMASFCWRLSNK